MSNISNGGIFVATEESFDLNEAVQVEILLSYCGESVLLEGEVVHFVSSELAATGATPGVAVQFLTSARDLRGTFEARFGVAAPSEVDANAGRRRAPRSLAQLPTTLVTEDDTELVTRTRDVSETGALISVAGQAIPVGELVQLTMSNPSSGEEIELSGSVVRELKNDAGQVMAVGIEFDTPETRLDEVSRFMSDAKAAEHSRRLAGINGPIAELGIQNLLQMFGTSASAGTLNVSRGAEEGFIAFEGGLLCAAQLGSATGRPALAEMLSWQDGNFEFQASIDPSLVDPDGDSLTAAILDALCESDEQGRADMDEEIEEDWDSQWEAAEEAEEEADEEDVEDDSMAASLDDHDEVLEFVEDIDVGEIDIDEMVVPQEEPIELADESDYSYEEECEADPSQQAASLSADTKLRLNEHALEDSQAELSRIEVAIIELANVGMTAGKLFDVIPEARRDVYSALGELLARGVVETDD